MTTMIAQDESGGLDGTRSGRPGIALVTLMAVALVVAPTVSTADALEEGAADTGAVLAEHDEAHTHSPAEGAHTDAGGDDDTLLDTIISDPRYKSSTAIAGTICLVCKKPVTAEDVSIVFRGRRIALHTNTCLAVWNAARDSFMQALSPPEAFAGIDPTVAPSLSSGRFVFGIYVMLGLFFGGLCAYVAASRGHAPIPWFAAGLTANLLAFLALLFRPDVVVDEVQEPEVPATPGASD